MRGEQLSVQVSLNIRGALRALGCFLKLASRRGKLAHLDGNHSEILKALDDVCRIVQVPRELQSLLGFILGRPVVPQSVMSRTGIDEPQDMLMIKPSLDSSFLGSIELYKSIFKVTQFVVAPSDL